MNTERIRAFFFDIDGTLCDDSNKMSESTTKALKQLKQKGYLLFLSTGRPMRSLKLFFDANDFVFDGYVYLNGQCCHYKDRDIREIYLSKKDAEKGLDFLIRNHIETNVHQKEKTCTLFHGEEHRLYKIELCDMSTLDYEHIHQLSPFLKEGEKLEELKKIMKSCEVTRWSTNGVDVIVKGSGKIEGIKAILNERALTFDQIVSFGDSENDIDMLRVSGISIAMGNALDECKKVADYVTDDMYHDGIAKALIHYGFISQEDLLI